MPAELLSDPVAVLGALLLLGGATGLLAWIDAWAPRGGIERTFGGFLLACLAPVLPELVMAAVALGLGDVALAEGVAAASMTWRLALCGLLATALPPARNPLTPGRGLATLLPAVMVVTGILAFASLIVRGGHHASPSRRGLAAAIVLAPYLGCLWLAWRGGLESKGDPPAGPESDLEGPPGPRPPIGRAAAMVLAVAAGGALLAWAVDGSLGLLRAAHGGDMAWRAHPRRVFLILGALLAAPGATLAWRDRRRAATVLRPTRELLACATLVVLLTLTGLGPAGGADDAWALAVLAGIAGGALVVLFASAERLVPVQVRGAALLLAAAGGLALAWRA